MPKDLYKAAGERYGDVRFQVHCESWDDGRILHMLLDTKRGYVSVLRVRQATGDNEEEQPLYVFGHPHDRERARKELTRVFKRRLTEARAGDDWDTIAHYEGRIAEEVETVLDGHGAYGEPTEATADDTQTSRSEPN